MTLFIDYLQKSHKINVEYSDNLLWQLREAVKTKRPGKKLTNVVLFHQHSAPGQLSLFLMVPACNCGIELVDHHLLHLSSIPQYEKITWLRNIETVSQ